MCFNNFKFFGLIWIKWYFGTEIKYTKYTINNYLLYTLFSKLHNVKQKVLYEIFISYKITYTKYHFRIFNLKQKKKYLIENNNIIQKRAYYIF